MAVYNEILRRRPDALERLYQGFEWDRMDEHGDDEDPTSGYRVPVFSQAGGKVSCQYTALDAACRRPQAAAVHGGRVQYV